MTPNAEKSPAGFTFLLCCATLGVAFALPVWDCWYGLPLKGDAVEVMRVIRDLSRWGTTWPRIVAGQRRNLILLLAVTVGGVAVGRLTHRLIWVRTHRSTAP
jgi:hypothetical protein